MGSFYKCKSYSHFLSKNISIYVIFNDDQSFNDLLTNNIFSFEQLGPGIPENSLTTAADDNVAVCASIIVQQRLLFYKVVTPLLS